MNVADTFYEALTNSFEGFDVFTENLINVSVKFALYLRSEFLSAISAISFSIEFTEFQVTLLKVLLSILGLNLILIAFYWWKYGEVITEKFVKPSTLKEIEELKLSVERLKLPKEHTPRL